MVTWVLEQSCMRVWGLCKPGKPVLLYLPVARECAEAAL